MIKPSPEIEAVIVRWMAAYRGKQGRPLTNLLSTTEHLRYMGTAPDEYWSGSLLRRGLVQHVTEVPDWTAESPEVEAFENGDTGWATWRTQVRFAGREQVYDVRGSYVLTMDDGVWRIVKVHLSMAYPNIDFSGIEQQAFADLIKAAEEGHEGFGDEGTAVIMLTDVANSTEIANALGDREWAVAIGNQLDQQAMAIAKNEGKLVKTLGDVAMSSFASACSTIRAASEIQAMNVRLNQCSINILIIQLQIHSGFIVENHKP